MTSTSPAPTLVLFRPPSSTDRAAVPLAAIGGIEGLGRAVAHGRAWDEIGSGTVVVRSGADPRIGVIGRFDEAGLARLHGLQWQLDHVLPRLVLLSYADVERAVERLASALVNRFGDAVVRGFRFTAIPRGGHVVLGLLAYALGLKRGQLETAFDDPRPLVVVDDCALSGLRLRQVLDDLPARRSVIFAPLVASAELCAAVERDHRVRACVRALDLRDAAPVQLGTDHASWTERWHARHGGASFWIGRPQHVCFPWNEPDVAVWNEVAEREDAGWPLVPPELCAKHRALGRRSMPLFMPTSGPGPLRPTDDLVFGPFEGAWVLAAPGWPRPVSLDGVAATMWTAVLEHGEVAAAARTVAATYEVDPEQVRSDLDGFVGALRDRGALVG